MPQAQISNGLLKKLYLTLIGHKVTEVKALAAHGGAASGTDKFIQLLVKRAADTDGAQILNTSLTI